MRNELCTRETAEQEVACCNRKCPTIHTSTVGITKIRVVAMKEIQQETISHNQLPDHYHRKKGKAILETGRGELWGCETLMLPHFLDNWLTYGGEVVNLTCWLAALYPQEDSWYSSVRG
jgi:hypothetical protein